MLMLITTSSQQVQLLVDLKILYPCRLKDNYSKQPWKRAGPLKTVTSHIYAYICTYSFLGLVQQFTNLTTDLSLLIKGDLFL